MDYDLRAGRSACPGRAVTSTAATLEPLPGKRGVLSRHRGWIHGALPVSDSSTDKPGHPAPRSPGSSSRGPSSGFECSWGPGRHTTQIVRSPITMIRFRIDVPACRSRCADARRQDCPSWSRSSPTTTEALMSRRAALSEPHTAGACLLLALVVVHVVAALYHAICAVSRAETDVLESLR